MTDFVKLAEVKPGDRLVADGGFTCIKAGAIVTVGESPTGNDWPGADLYIPCSHGKHFLDGQENDAGQCVGLVLAQ